MSDDTNGTEDPEYRTDDPEYLYKKIAFYQTVLGAWVQTKMETDKQLLTLSGLAIGLLMVFQSKLNSTLQLVLWLSAGGLFVGTIITILFIFWNNSAHIEDVIAENQEQDEEKKLEFKIKVAIMDKKLNRQTICAFVMFILGVILTSALAIAKLNIMVIIKQGV